MKRLLLSLVTMLFLSTILSAQKTIYVKQGSMGSGTSWENAYGNLDVALVLSNPGDQIWVAEGIYKPNLKIAEKDSRKKKTTDRDKAFVLKSGVKVYGGFSGNETFIDERRLGVHPSILSGDIGVENDSSDNVYHVVISVDAADGTLIDGFTITGGNADDYQSQIVVNGLKVCRGLGGGIHCFKSALTISNVTLKGNNASQGGGLYTESSFITIIKSVVRENKAIYGGGICNTESALTLSHVMVNGNTADGGHGQGEGGGIFNNRSSVTLEHSIIKENMAYWTGGGMYNWGSFIISTHVSINRNRSTYGGGMTNTKSSTFLMNTVVNGNAANYGGGVYNHTAVPSLVNVAIKGNNSVTGGGMFNYNSAPSLMNVVVCGNTAKRKDDKEGNGGGVCNEKSYPFMRNVTIGGNFASDNGGGMYNMVGSEPKLENTILWGNNTGVFNNEKQVKNSPIYEYSLVQGIDLTGSNGLDGTDTNLLVFVEPMAPVFPPTQRGNYRLVEGSSAIDKGRNEKIEKDIAQAQYYVNQIMDTVSEDFVAKYRNAYAELLLIAFTTDLDKNPRIIGKAVDLGAYEFSRFNVEFETNGADLINSIPTSYGNTILEPLTPMREGYNFAGWYKEPECINAWDFETDVVTSNITLYAGWE